MATREDELEPVIAHRGLVVLVVLDCAHRDELLVKLATPCGSTQLIDGAIPSCGDDPACRVWRDPFRGPTLRRHHKRILNRILGEGDVAKDPNQRRNGLTVGLTKDGLDLGRAVYESPI